MKNQNEEWISERLDSVFTWNILWSGSKLCVVHGDLCIYLNIIPHILFQSRHRVITSLWKTVANCVLTKVVQFCTNCFDILTNTGLMLYLH